MLCRIACHFPQIGEYASGQEVGADKVRRTVMGAFLVVAADITVLLALVRLVSLLIHDTTAVRTEQYAGEQAHFIIAVGAFALLAKLLHPFPCLGVYDRLVVVLENHLLFRGIFYTVLDFVRELFCLEVYQTACVFPVFKDMHNGIGRPLALIAGVVAAGAARPTVFQRPRREDLLLCEHTGYLGRTVPGKAEVVYLLDYGCSFLVNNEIFVLVHEVAIHRLACDGLATHAF